MTLQRNDLIRRIHTGLINSKRTVATAESCTAGLVAHLLTELSGASEFFKQGWVTYSIESKVKQLQIPSSEIHKYGVYSKQTAAHMALHARNIADANFGIGITGLTGASGSANIKDRYVCIAISTELECDAFEYVFEGDRSQIRNQAADEALKLLVFYVERDVNEYGQYNVAEVEKKIASGIKEEKRVSTNVKS